MNYKWAIFNSKLLNYQRVHNVILGCRKWWVTPWKQCGGFKPWRVAPSGFLGLPGLGFESQCCSSRLDAWWRINTTYLKHSKAIYQLRTHILLWHYHPQKKTHEKILWTVFPSLCHSSMYWVYCLKKGFSSWSSPRGRKPKLPRRFFWTFSAATHSSTPPVDDRAWPKAALYRGGQGRLTEPQKLGFGHKFTNKTWKLPNTWATFRKIVDPGSHFVRGRCEFLSRR